MDGILSTADRECRPWHERCSRGAPAILLACILWPSAYVIRKGYLQTLTPPVLMLLTSTAIALATIVFAPRLVQRAFRTARQMPVRTLGVSFFGAVLGSTLFLAALDRLDVGVAGVLEKIQPVFVVVLAAVVLHEKIDVSKIPAIAIALVASYFVAQRHPFTVSAGDASVDGMLLGVLAAAAYSGSSIMGRSLLSGGAKPLEVTFLRFALSIPFLIVLIALRGELASVAEIPLDVLAGASSVAVFLTAGGYLLYYRGLQDVPAGEASVLELSSSVFSVAIGIACRGEEPALHQLVAGGVLLIAVNRVTAKPERASEQRVVVGESNDGALPV